MTAQDLEQIFERRDRDQPEAFPYQGLFVLDHPDGTCEVQLDGHCGTIDEFHINDVENVAELVDRLNTHVNKVYDIQIESDSPEETSKRLVEWAGRVVTHDEERAQENPDIYALIPETS
jgi:hypothetical protein